MRKNKGFTLIELIMVIAIIGILSVSGAYLMLYLVQNSVFIPNKLNMDMIGLEALDIMIEGNSSAKGLRFSRIITIIQDNRVAFKNQDGRNIVYKLDTATKKLCRSIDGGSETPIPYYATSGINITGKNNKLFTYYSTDSTDPPTETTNPANVRRIKITLIAETGTGAYSDWEGRSEQSSSITVRKFELFP